MEKPVFVDPTGRRLGALRIAGRLAGAVFAGYLLLVVASLVAPPGLDRLQVPGVGGVIPAQRAPEVVTTDGDTDAADAVEDARRTGAAPVTGPARTPSPAAAPSPTPGRGVATPPGATNRPTSAPATTGKPTAPPGQTRTPPSQSSAKPTKGPTANPGSGQGNGKGNGRADRTAAPVGADP